MAARSAAIGVLRRLREAGQVAYLAGGCVRDELLGIAPSDYDVATDARPERVAALFSRTNAVGAAFGVMLVHHAPGLVTEVATFREDASYSDNRRPDSVRFSTPEADAQRRDFTINALFLDPLGEDAAADEGGVIDYVGGRADLAAGVVRAVGDPAARLAEDHLRALRAVRFACRFGFELEGGTAAAVREHARELSGVSRERVGQEVRKMLSHPSRGRAAGLLTELSLDAPVLDEPSAERFSARALAGLGEEPIEPGLGLAAWALDRGADAGRPAELVRRWRGALCLSNAEAWLLGASLEAFAELRERWPAWGVAKRKRLAASSCFGPGLALVGAVEPERARAIRADVERLEAHAGGCRPIPLVDGSDLIGIGLRPSPLFKRVLDAVYDAQLEGRVREKSEALALAKELSGGRGVQGA